MRKRQFIIVITIWTLMALPAWTAPLGKDTSQSPSPIELSDILSWKSIRSSVVSNNGQWFAYRLVPTEGDSEVVIRRTGEVKELRYPAGEPSRSRGRRRFFPGGSRPSGIAFSEDSRWVTFTIFPKAKEAKSLRKAKKPLRNKAGLVNLSTEELIEVDNVKKAAFSGENPHWVAFHKYPGPNQGKGKKKWLGSDLILRRLDTGVDSNIGNVSEFAFDKKGSYLAWAVDARDQSGNGIQLRKLDTGTSTALDSGQASYKKIHWTESGDGLAVLKGVEDKGYKDKLYSVFGFTQFSDGTPRKVVYDPRGDQDFPTHMTISPNRAPVWMKDLDGILFGIHEVKEKKKKDKAGKGEREEDAAAGDRGSRSAAGPDRAGRAGKEDGDLEKPDLVIWHWRDKRMQSMQQVQEKRDKNFSYLAIYRIDEKKFIRLADEHLRQVTAKADYRYGVGLDNSEYEWMGNLDGRRYQDIYSVDLRTGRRQLAVKKNRWYFGPSPEGTHFLYYDDGNYFTYDMAAGRAQNITETISTSFINTEDDHNVVKPPIRPMGWVKDGVSVLLSDNWDVWNVSVHGDQATNLTVNGKKDRIRYRRRFRLDPDEKGADLSGPVYFGALDERTKQGGILRVDRSQAGARMLLWDAATFNRLVKAKSADTFLYTKETYANYPDYYATDNSLQAGRKITEADPQQKQFLWSKGSRLINYTSAKGDKLQAALFLPADYAEGQSYPTIVYIYEKLTQGLNRYYTPSANGFNKSVYTSNGYAVLMPDIVYKVDDPGRSAVWCVVPAVKAAIATGVVDPKHVGIHGHSWGGYQTAFLITQTNIFSAAVAGAPLTNMISMYSSIYWNTGTANQPIFESSQGRFTGGYWDVPDAYTRNSPVYFAKNVTTPLIILHNDKDGAVDWNQGIEYFNTLRRLKKPVVMLQYKGENHGLRKPANQKDYTVRMKEFFDHHLKGKEAPAWLKKGVTHLKMQDHLEQRVKELIKKKPDKKKTTTETNG